MPVGKYMCRRLFTFSSQLVRIVSCKVPKTIKSLSVCCDAYPAEYEVGGGNTSTVVISAEQKRFLSTCPIHILCTSLYMPYTCKPNVLLALCVHVDTCVVWLTYMWTCGA